MSIQTIRDHAKALRLSYTCANLEDELPKHTAMGSTPEQLPKPATKLSSITARSKPLRIAICNLPS